MTAVIDGLGRTDNEQLNSDPAGIDYTATTYDADGRKSSVSDPYRSTSDPTYGLTTYQYDGLSRVTKLIPPDGSSSANNVSTTYADNCTTVTDQQSKSRASCTDALGRLTQVTEDPGGLGYITNYQYDTLDNLTQLTQGSQTRTFAYDSLSRLTSSTNPESGTTHYCFTQLAGTACATPDTGTTLCSGDPSAVCRRTDARSITTTHAYDALNRLTSKSYSDGTPVANFFYDSNSATINGWTISNLANTKGRLRATCTNTAVGSCSGSTTATVYSYDPVGRVAKLYQCTPYNCPTTYWETDYTYDLAGDLGSWSHPAGFTITNTINGAQQTTQMGSTLNDSKHPGNLIQSASYTPFGAVDTLVGGTVGGGKQWQEMHEYNNRLQPVRIQLGEPSSPAANSCQVYNYYSSLGNVTSCTLPGQGTGNNGTTMGYFYQDTTNPTLTHSATYQYDTLNRLATASASGSGLMYSLTFSLDRYGNMATVTNGVPNNTFNTKNQISNTGVAYDGAGNLTNNGAGHTFQWDAENRMISLDNGSTWSGTYNALGQRAERAAGGGKTEYLYDMAGQDIGHFDGVGQSWANEYVNFAGRIISYYGTQTGDNGTRFFHVNALGSIGMATNEAGAYVEEILYYPWGQIWTGNNYNAWDARFASMPLHDNDLSLEATPNRIYASGQGRWLSPDPAGTKAVTLTDPQTWNMYSYVRNNPTTLTDPSGLEVPVVIGNTVYAGSVRTVPETTFWQDLKQEAVLAGYASGVLVAPEAAAALLIRFAPLATSAGAAMVKARDAASEAIEGLKELPLSDVTAGRLGKALNAIADHLQDSDVAGAIREQAGVLQGNHVTEVGDAIRSLEKLAQSLSGALENPGLTDAQRQAYTQALQKLNALIDAGQNVTKAVKP